MARARVLALLAALPLGACATAPRQPWVLPSEGLHERPVTDLDRIATYPQALATTLDIMQQDLGLPALRVQLVFLPDTKSLRQTLLEIGYPPKLAREAARQMVAIGGHQTVLINQARLESRGWPWRLSILAHELGHVLQYQLGGGRRGTSAQWLREGFAEWLATRVMEALEPGEAAKAWQRAMMLVRAHAQLRVLTLGGARSFPEWIERPHGRARVPSLSALGSFPEWVEHSGGDAGDILYDYAFIAVTSLIEQHGTPAVLRYFELFASRQDPSANFLEAFGEEEEQLEKRLRQLVWP